MYTAPQEPSDLQPFIHTVSSQLFSGTKARDTTGTRMQEFIEPISLQPFSCFSTY